MIDFRNTKFVTSAPDISRLPADTGVEIAFAGRSNAGKSTALNRLTGQKNLAKTSKTPGRTRLINLFEIEPGKRLVDLPGYGYAEAPKSIREQWQRSLTRYLRERRSLRGIAVLMDIRHPLKDLDRQIITWAVLSNLEIIVVLTKCDKLAPNARKNAVSEVKRLMTEFGCSCSPVAFSALSGQGLDELRSALDRFYNQFGDDSPDAVPGTGGDDDGGDGGIDTEAWERAAKERQP